MLLMGVNMINYYNHWIDKFTLNLIFDIKGIKQIKENQGINWITRNKCIRDPGTDHKGFPSGKSPTFSPTQLILIRQWGRIIIF